jgi:hypothetical protein
MELVPVKKIPDQLGTKERRMIHAPNPDFDRAA